MWFCIWFVQVFLLVTNVTSRGSNEDVKLNAYKKTVFTDVIRNISKVTDVLQDLIKDQKKLEEINKSQGYVDDSEAYIKDEEQSEGKEQFKDLNKSSRYEDDSEAYSEDKELSESSTSIFNKKAEEKKHVSLPPAFHVTRMIISSEESEASSDSASNNNEIDDKAHETKTTKMGTQEDFFPNKSDNEETYSHSSFSEESVAHQREQNKNEKPTVNKPEVIISNNIHKAITTPPKTKFTEKKRGIKTRYKLIEHRDDENDIQSNSKILPSINKPESIMEVSTQPKYNTNIKQIVHTETFHKGKIWNDIIKNKPINLKPETDNTNFRSGPKTALVILTAPKSWLNQENSERDSALESESEEDIAMDKEIFKSKILRQAYGDACLKVVIRKCYKACKSANKEVCSAKKCKRNFKKKFNEKARTGCLKEFYNNTSIKSLKDADDFFDITRQGYMASCLPMFKPSRRENETSLVSTATSDKFADLKILRDRYEKACQKASKNKCNSACKYALKETCRVYECSKSKQKQFNKACKRQCKISYRSTGKITNKASGSSDSDDTSEDDSSNDSDSSDTDGSSSKS